MFDVQTISATVHRGELPGILGVSPSRYILKTRSCLPPSFLRLPLFSARRRSPLNDIRLPGDCVAMNGGPVAKKKKKKTRARRHARTYARAHARIHTDTGNPFNLSLRATTTRADSCKERKDTPGIAFSGGGFSG